MKESECNYRPVHTSLMKASSVLFRSLRKKVDVLGSGFVFSVVCGQIFAEAAV